MFTETMANRIMLKLTVTGGCRHLSCHELAIRFHEGKKMLSFHMMCMVVSWKSAAELTFFSV